MAVHFVIFLWFTVQAIDHAPSSHAVSLALLATKRNNISDFHININDPTVLSHNYNTLFLGGL